MMLNEEICPKCKMDKMPFDVHCDSCYEFSIKVNIGKKQEIKMALNTLGYKFIAFIEPGGKWGEDRDMIRIEAPRKDEIALIKILSEQ